MESKLLRTNFETINPKCNQARVPLASSLRWPLHDMLIMLGEERRAAPGGRGSFFIGRQSYEKWGYEELRVQTWADEMWPVKSKGMGIKHPKLRGEWAELRFMARAAELGLQVTKPWGETARYDFAVEHDGGLYVTGEVHDVSGGRGYSCTVRGCRGPYTGDPFDFVAAYLIPEDTWYIIPRKRFQGQGVSGFIRG